MSDDRPAPPTQAEVEDVLRTVMDPELGADIMTLGMVPSVTVAADGIVTIGIKLTIGGCPLRADVMSKARWNARDNAPANAVPTDCQVLAIASGKGGVGKSSCTVNLSTALAALGFTVGVLDADIWGFSVPRLLGMSDRMEAERVPGSEKPMIIPNRKAVGDGMLEVVSTGFL